MSKKINFIYPLIATVALSLYGATVNAQQNNKPAATAPPVPTAHIGQDHTSGVIVNYVRTWDAMGPITDPNAITGADYKDAKQVTEYIDGLGRPLQAVSKQITPGIAPKDMVSPVEYDALGREMYKYLPYVSIESNGAFKMNPFSEQAAFMGSRYNNEEHVFYSQTEYEASPLSRVKKTMAPGNSWAGNGKGVSMDYMVNKTEDDVRIWNINSNPLTYVNNDVTNNMPYNPTTPNYNPGELYKKVTKDEANNAIVEYKNKEGQVVLKKVQIDGTMATDYSGYIGFLCTYYVYDDLNQLRFVIPPKAVNLLIGNGWQFTDDIINELCFRYEYDAKQRMIAKKVPGAGWLYMVYDVRDRLVFTQDANMRAKSRWMTTLYDGLNRPVMTGMMTWSGGTPADLQTVVTSQPSSTVPPGTLSDRTLPETGQSVPISGTYQATNSITLIAGFESGSDFTAEIVGGSNGGPEEITIDGVQVNRNPIPPGAGFIALAKTFYDKYDWNTTTAFNTAYNAILQNSAGTDVTKAYNLHPVGMPSTAHTQTQGLVTGSMVRVIENPDNLTAGVWLTTVNFYDDRSRIIQVNSQTHKGRDIITNRYDFTGKVICSYLDHAVTGGIPANIHVKTNMIYDHAGRLMEVWKTINDDDNKKVLIAINEYDELGQLKKKSLGRQKDDNGTYTSEALGSFAYSYNVRGWMTGINKEYANGASQPGITNPWFGMELNYDRGFEKNQLNGNIAGTKWRSRGDDARRAYGYTYDKVNRILGADFTQSNGSTYIDDAIVKFDMKMGSGLEDGSAYDENGNIKAMTQWGLKLNSSTEIDKLTYQYAAGGIGNKLTNVSESGSGATTHKLGDFTDNNTSGDDYTYDDNGNMITDLNKRINGIKYNHLNLPWEIPVKNDAQADKGKITYTYDAAGNKLKKVTFEQNATVNNYTTTITTTTSYVGGFIYESKSYDNPALSGLAYTDKLQFFGHEEGRTRYIAAEGSNQARFEYDYFVKDHLGNVRMVLTEERQKDPYPAVTFEDANITNEQIYYEKVDEQRVNRSGDGSNKSQLLRKSTQSIGVGKLMKVMYNDKIHVKVDYFTPNETADNSNANGVEAIITQLLTLLNSTAAPGQVHGSGAVITSELQNANPFTSFLEPQVGPSGTTMPKAYLNILFFDEQFKFIPENSEIVPVSTKGNLSSLTRVFEDAKVAPKNGYVYIYVSNESNNFVYFDNFQVTHERGALVEETHYYPFGLTMAGISGKAMGRQENKYKFNNGTELQNNEYTDGNGLELYETKYRSLDPQLGRFWQIDPMADFSFGFSPYAYGNNNPILLNDPLGLLSDSSKPQVLQQVIVSANKPLQGGDYNGMLFSKIKEVSYSSFGYSRIVRKQEVPDKQIEQTFQAWTEELKRLSKMYALGASLVGGSVLDIQSMENYKEIFKRLLKERKITVSNPALLAIGTIMGIRAGQMDNQVDAIMKILSDYHIMQSNSGSLGNGIYVITESNYVNSMGGSGGSETHSYYDVKTNKLIGSTYEHY